MLDLALRPVKETILLPLVRLIPSTISPDTLTYTGFLIGLSIPLFSALSHSYFALFAWIINRLLDGLDGTVARQRRTQSKWGGYIDIVCDFTVRSRHVSPAVMGLMSLKQVYSLIPIGVALCPLSPPSEKTQLPLSLLLASFHVNNVILFYLSSALPPSKVDEMTSLRMVPAIIEGSESLVFLTVMILLPRRFCLIASTMAVAVGVNVVQRSVLAYSAFEKERGNKS
ncbi:MAG: hypothetical protein TREMPRED_000802 [Tremellales sp. Tagirdzhanova-0007]|nr:MAG: hypothetical protein TREMPRED_000802 [Tremellales sp. Tagirdzhanova-0007]